MNRFSAVRLAAVAAFVAASSSPALAADTQNMTVQATVVGTCKLGTMPLLDFGTLDQVAAPAVNPAAVNVQYRCTKNTAPTTFSVGGSTSGTFNGSLGNGTDTIAYTITWTNPTTKGSGLGTGVTPVDVALTGSMTGGANYQNVSAGTYTQSVAIVINP